MFNKFKKKGLKKPSKLEQVEPPMPISSSAVASNLNLNHASVLSSVPENPGVIEVLPLLKDVAISDKHGVFIRKVQNCCIFFDFSDTMKSAREKEIKRQTIAELVDLVQSGSCKMNEIMQEQLVNMISLNIFRSLPPASHENKGFNYSDPEEEDVFMDPSWPHLQLVYELLLRYVVSGETESKMAKKYIDHSFVLKLLTLFDTEDSREREYVKIIVHRMYGRFMVLRPFIRHEINNILYQFIFETERYNGVGDLLEIVGSLINGFAMPMKEEHKLFLIRALIPLHKAQGAASYHQKLSYCVPQFVEKDYRLADTVIIGILKYWPVTNCAKEVLFLGEVEEILDVTETLQFQRCMIPLFRRIGRCLNSPHFQVAERALFWWNNEHIVGLIGDNRQVILPIIFDALEENIRSHWNQAINGLSINVRRMFLEMDFELFTICETQYFERQIKAVQVEEQRLSNWKLLEEGA